ncbi:hypothetical protein C6O39_04365 [Salmonella enterica]|nr:hypothetical protein [Salmonella enterica]EAW1956241.1 hypothetical protein [Salmonella enterica subsp. enterica]EBH3852557.1 hypothetical protein [Salmonella enterica subsp. diarizonae]EBH8063556.1 hypothetical protein [Salmonella bongori]EBH9876030.1 hypothetical protein [Salmonella enterica subsp. enterica serovar 6,7:-1,5]EBT7754129.1 hypothetical protein [Salmonella enterica subsp. diarizonae serovar 61:k:1,5,7]ECU4601916.1 hypothetical protein [Salmonella enterica subsp. diarizonae s
MMIFSLISAVNDGVLLPARAHFPLDENKFVEPVIIGGDEERTVQFGMLLDQLKLYPHETADPLCVSINAVTPCCGESNAYQLAVSTGQLPLYVSEISELMKDFLYQHVVDANGYVKMTFPDICNGLNSLWRTFAEENLSGTLKAEKVLCSPYIMPVSVLGETSSLEEEKMTLKDVMNFKKIQSAFKHELHSIQKSLNVLNNHEAVERFKENKTLELLLQTGVHTGIGIAGGVLGAVIGTAIVPGLGTFIGAGIGAGLAWAGKKLYDYAAGVVSNKINPNPHLKNQEIDRKIKSAEKGTVWECGAKIKSLVVEPSRAGGILVASLISSVIKGVSLPIHDIATACYDYERASEGLTPEKASKIEALLVKYHSKLNKEYEQVLGYLEENPTPDNQRRKNKILERDAVICERLAAIRESIKDAVESRR